MLKLKGKAKDRRAKMKPDRYGFRSYSILYIVFLACVLILHIVCMLSPRWLITNEGHAGIWVHCPTVMTNENGSLTAIPWNSNVECSSLQSSISITISVIYIISIVFLIISLFLVANTVRVVSQKEEHRLRYAFLSLCICALLMLIVILMKVVAPVELSDKPADIGWPVYVAICAVVTYIFMCVLLVLQMQRIRRGPQYHTTGVDEEEKGVLRIPSTRQRLNIEVLTKEEAEAAKKG